MEISLTGKRVFITGATGAIGGAILKALKESGAWVAGSYFQSEEEAARLMGQGVFMVQADLSDRARARGCVASVLEQGPLDALIYAAGNTRDRTIFRLTDSDWDDVRGLHLDGLVACTQAVLPAMRERKSGKLIAVGSLSGSIGRAGQANYSAVKAATVAFVKSVAREAGRFGITANVILPGFVDSRMTRAAPPAAWERAKADSALGTISSAETVASFAAWLLSDLAQGVTGQIFQLDSRVV
ncbi:MAG: SDR family oxidoreductase [Candidatus Omnitrophica bacterium]|nr:SDR family oxidoreductase [Candidatus Omnitrophota bacterium]